MRTTRARYQHQHVPVRVPLAPSARALGAAWQFLVVNDRRWRRVPIWAPPRSNARAALVEWYLLAMSPVIVEILMHVTAPRDLTTLEAVRRGWVATHGHWPEIPIEVGLRALQKSGLISRLPGATGTNVFRLTTAGEVMREAIYLLTTAPTVAQARQRPTGTWHWDRLAFPGRYLAETVLVTLAAEWGTFVRLHAAHRHRAGAQAHPVLSLSAVRTDLSTPTRSTPSDSAQQLWSAVHRLLRSCA